MGGARHWRRRRQARPARDGGSTWRISRSGGQSYFDPDLRQDVRAARKSLTRTGGPMPNPLANIYLKLDGIDGESAAKNHKKEIDVFSYEQGIDQSVLHSGSGGASAVGKAKYSPVRFRKDVDVASIPMLLACAQGKAIKDAVFTFTRGASGFEFYK